MVSIFKIKCKNRFFEGLSVKTRILDNRSSVERKFRAILIKNFFFQFLLYQAEERLLIIEEQRKMDEQRQKMRKEQEKRVKEEQNIILGKKNSRPKLSFSIKPGVS